MNQTMNLDKRQRAMLREMGVRVWQPMAPVPALPAASASPPALIHPEVAIDSIAADVRVSSPRGISNPQPNLQPVPAQPPAEVRSDSAVSWSAGDAQALYAQAKPAPGPRWLVLAETPAAAVQPEHPAADSPFNPFEGEAGKLLDNMLRAVRLHKTGTVMLAPLVRRIGVGIGINAAPEAGFAAALATLVHAVQPDVVLVMGRLAAQALLQSSEPFGKLRGQVHTLHGVRTIVTHDAAYLLRSPLEKARAWEDLCLAVSVL